MKLTTIFLLLACLRISANGLSQTITLTGKDISLVQVFSTIEQQTGYVVFYNYSALKKAKRVTIKAKGMLLQSFLEKCFEGQPFQFVVEGKTIMVSEKNEEKRFVTTEPAVPVGVPEKIVTPIKGRVLDEEGKPVAGANIVVKGSEGGTTSDEAGNFTIEGDIGAWLVISSVGFNSREVKITTASNLDVTLARKISGLNEVIVVGYGTQAKRNVTTAIASVKGEKLADLPVANPTQALVGQVSGVFLQQTSGAPGDPPVVRIRGNGSITSGNGPLYVIDGYPTSDASLMNAISPQDIESMEILKDAASAAIYGSRAGNGVIMVTTKRGKSGKTQFNMDLVSGFESVMKKYDLMNAQEFVDMAKEGLTYQNKPIPAFLNQPDRWANTDWQDVIFRSAPFQNYQISARGGTDKAQFAISGGFMNQQGILRNTFMKRYNVRASFDAKVTNTLKVGMNVQPSFTQRRVQQTTGGNTSTGVDGILAEALTMPPILPVWRPNGDYFVITQDPEMKTIFNDELSNPLVKLDANKDYFYTFRQTGNAYLEYKPIKGLTLNSTFNVGIVSEKEEYYVEPFLARGNGNTGNISTPNLAQIKARRNNTTNFNWYWSNTASYNFSLHDKHHFTALLGYDVARQNDFYITLEPRTDKDNPVAFVNSNVKNVMGAVLTQGTSEKREYVFDAVFGRINYNLNNKYMFSASLRRDRSSRFGPDNRAGIFPSVSAGWNVSDEPFMESIPAISLLKIRASYGETGNDQVPGYYPWITTMQREYYNFGSTDAQVVGFRPGGFSNPQLGWEKNKQFDAGIDIGLIKNRIDLAVDFYNRNSNIILNMDLPSINGRAASVITNVGNVRNRGLEITLNTANLVTPFKWNTNFNISFNWNTIVSLANGQTQLNNQGVVRNYVGRPMGDLYMYIVDGTFNSADDLAKYPKLGSQGVGDLRYKDVTPDNVINANDQTYVGNYQPDFIFGLGNSFSYKNFSLDILLDGSYGAEVYRSQELAVSLSRWLENGSKESMGRWKSADDPGNGRYHRAGTLNLSSDIASSTRYLADGDFLRIRNITFGYNVPAKLLGKLKLQRLRAYVTGQNIYTFTKFKGFGNPQGNGGGDNATNNGVETGTYPLARNISVGVNITF